MKTQTYLNILEVFTLRWALGVN